MKPKPKDTKNTINQLLKAYGANPSRWPMTADPELHKLINSSDSLKKEHDQQLELDAMIDQANKSYQRQFSNAQIEQNAANILATINQQAVETSKKQSRTPLPRLLNWLVQPVQTAITATALVSLVIVLLFNSNQPEQRNVSNPDVVQYWLWSELNPEMLDAQSEIPVAEVTAFSESDLISEDI